MKENIGSNFIPICSDSSLRRDAARYFGISVFSVDDNANGIAEKQTKGKIGDGCITPLRRDKDSPPLPLELSIDKAIAIEKNRQRPNSFITIDSVFLVRMPNNEEFLIHKPETDEDIERVVRLFYEGSLVGAEISSFSGITVYRNGKYNTYTIELKLGKINSNVDWDGLTKRIKGNNSHAAGFSTIDIINGNCGNLVRLSKSRRIKIREYKNESREGKACYVTEKNKIIDNLIYSNDPTNNPITVALSVGIIPHHFLF